MIASFLFNKTAVLSCIKSSLFFLKCKKTKGEIKNKIANEKGDRAKARISHCTLLDKSSARNRALFRHRNHKHAMRTRFFTVEVNIRSPRLQLVMFVRDGLGGLAICVSTFGFRQARRPWNYLRGIHAKLVYCTHPYACCPRQS